MCNIILVITFVLAWVMFFLGESCLRSGFCTLSDKKCLQVFVLTPSVPLYLNRHGYMNNHKYLLLFIICLLDIESLHL